MWFEFLTLFTALTISGVAAYYSIIGLTAIFAAAFWPIVIMGGVLEFGKIVTSVWLKKYWHHAGVFLKCYLTFAVAVLMLITSMGIFGYLSKAHMDQAVPTGDVAARVSLIDEKIKTERDNIETARAALSQMDAQVNARLSRGDSEQGAERAVQIRRQQARERQQLQNEIAAAQKKIAALNEERAPIASELRKVEAEVGPIKYVAALIYGDNPDANLLERSVRWVIIIIVCVFDPLAIALILAANSSMRWAERLPAPARPEQDHAPEPQDDNQADVDHGECPHCNTKLLFASGIGPFCPNKTCEAADSVAEVQVAPEEPKAETLPEYLTKPWAWGSTNLAQVPNPPIDTSTEPEKIQEVQQSIPTVNSGATIAQLANMPITADISVPEAIPHEDPAPATPPETSRRRKVEPPAVPETLNVRKKVDIAPVADNVDAKAARSGFGTSFPETAALGDMFLRVDYLPNRLFKYNGATWIEVDKSKTDVYAYDERYILFVIEKLKSGEYELEQLSTIEQELVAEKLIQLNNADAKNINFTSNS